MSQLSAQSIQRLCQTKRFFGLIRQKPMISPFSNEKVVVSGKSYGLSSASYDLRIAHDLELGVNPSIIMQNHFLKHGLNDHFSDVLDLKLRKNLSHQALAYTQETFNIPDNVVAYICDKSTYARHFVGAFNTLFDPGFQGDGVLELVNFGTEPIKIKAGDPIVQIAFHWLDKKTDRPYRGKYFNQKGIQGPIAES